MVGYSRWQPRGSGILKICALAGAAVLTMAAAGAPPRTATWTISAIKPPQVPNGSLAAESCPARGTCVAVGYYRGPGGPSRPLAELWDGSAWRVLPAPNPSGGHGSAFDAVSCLSASACTAVGSYLNGSRTRVTLIEVWNGTAWQVQPSPTPAGSFDGRLTGVSCTSASACVAVGYYQNQDFEEYPVAFAESWDGQAWTIQQVPNGGAFDSYLYAISCTSSAACIATGSYSNSAGTDVPFAGSWDGTSWTMQVPGAPSDIYRSELTGVSCTSATACTAVGDYVQKQSPFAEQTLAETWNGSAWTIQPTPDPGGYDGLAAVSCAAATSCTAVGSEGGQSQQALAEVWNGSTWTAQAPAQPAGAADSLLAGVSCTAPGACVAAGSAYHAQPGTSHTLAEGQQGSTWTIQASPDRAGALFSYLNGVSCTTATSCVAVGSVADAWNGTAWTALAIARPPGATNLKLGAVSCTAATACMAVGSYDASGAARPLAESWNGSSWHIQAAVDPAGATAPVLAGVSCTTASACIAVGSYTDPSGISQALAESWNGTSWSLQPAANPSNTGNTLYSVSCTSASACTAVGSYDRPFHYNALTLVEAWNGSTWTQQPTTRSGYLFSVSCAVATACAAVGYSGSDPLAGTWNGTAWDIRRLSLPANSYEAFLNGVSCSTATSCTAAGYSDQLNTGYSLTLAEHWNGAAWAIQPTPNPPGAQASGLGGISCATATACAAVGSYGPFLADLGVDAPFAEQR